MHQAADTYVDQLQSYRPEILYPNLSKTPQNRNLEKNILSQATQPEVRSHRTTIFCVILLMPSPFDAQPCSPTPALPFFGDPTYSHTV